MGPSQVIWRDEDFPTRESLLYPMNGLRKVCHVPAVLKEYTRSDFFLFPFTFAVL